ncbi:MAG: 50S ribosomal protein L23 [Oligoflexia bacterium]|nr:50S ribosomal protein L23 [Oligoflexia bacterium]
MATRSLSIIKRPLITEKNTGHLARNVYAFEVVKDASKTDIARAIEIAFKVKVVGVRTMVGRDRTRRMGRFVSGVNFYKKALVEVAQGQKIKVFEGA